MVVLTRNQRSGTRSRPFLPLHHRRRRTKRHVARRRNKMLIVHGNRTEPALPKVTVNAQPSIDITSVVAVSKAKRSPQPVLVAWNCNYMHMIGHQTVGPILYAGPVGRIGKQIELGCIVRLREKHSFTPIAALSDVVRYIRQGEMGQASHNNRLCPEHNCTNNWTLSKCYFNCMPVLQPQKQKRMILQR